MSILLALSLLLPQTPSVPEDLGAFVRETGRLERVQAQRAFSAAARVLESREVSGENLLYAGLILGRAYRHQKAMEHLQTYLAGRPANRELALAGLIDAASWPDTDYALARRSYETYLREFPDSKATDPLGRGALLRRMVEEAMARVSALDGEDQVAAAQHYQRALEAAAAGSPESFPIADLFRLRWWRADAIAASGKLDEALDYLLATRPLVKSDPKSALDLEDRIVFKQTDKMMNERKYAEARAMIVKRLPEFASDPILTRRVSKLLDRLKLVDAPAAEFVSARWIGGGPHTLAALRGKVVLLEFFTSG